MYPANDAPTRVEPSFAHPVSEMLTRYLSIASPARARATISDDGPPLSTTASRRSAQLRAEELWDELGDFA
jgi:hypothetical protein